MVIIAVKNCTGEVINISMKASATIGDLKAKLIDDGIRIENLNFGGKQLENGRTLSEFVPLFEIVGGEGREGREGGAGGVGGAGGGDDDPDDGQDDEPEDEQDDDPEDEQDDESEDEQDEDDGMKIFVQIPHLGKTITLDVMPTESIQSVKHQILGKEGIPVRHQRLICASESIHDGTLDDYYIDHETTIQLVLNIRGGGKRGRVSADEENSTAVGAIPDLDTFAMQVLPADPQCIKDVITLDKVDINKFIEQDLTIDELEEMKAKVLKYSSYNFKDTPIRQYGEKLPLLRQLRETRIHLLHPCISVFVFMNFH